MAAPRILIIAPSGWPPDLERYDNGLRRLREAGFEVLAPERGRRRQGRFAGSEAERAADLNALADPDAELPELVMLPRGGYGAIHLLDRIDYARLCPRLRQAGTLLVGYSDFTNVQMALLARGGVVTWSGPMLAVDLGVPEPDPAMLAGFAQAIASPVVEVRVDQPQRCAGAWEGTFWGGNLATLVALAGTPYLPDIQGGLLYLEDDAETPYRVDRMLFQLLHAGILGRQRAVVLGSFTNGPEDTVLPGYTLERVVENLRDRLDVPILTGLPCGHIPGLRTLPIGGRGRLAAGPEGFTLTLTGHPYLRREPAGLKSWGSGRG